ncbi:MAG TPA: extracellular solute-binding protein [Azospirillaceae bacterium]|nr:extracellular solute-binding protein [Azospirillaceae bacterium]
MSEFKHSTLRRLLLRVTAFAAPALLVAGFAGEAAAQKQLTVWHAYRGGEKAAFEKAVNAFNEANKAAGISAKTLAVPYDAYADKISAAVPRGTGPDVFIFAQDRLGGWIEAGNIVEPVDFYIDDQVKGRFLPNMMEAVTYRNTAYGLPFNFKSIAMIYNKKAVASPPKTTKELVEWAKKNTDSGSGKYGLGYVYGDFFYHAAVMNAFGGGVFKQEGAAALPTATVNQPANIKSVDLVMKWYKDDKILPAEPSTALITSLFNEGKTNIVFSGPWFLGEVDKSIEVGVTNLPTVDEAGGAPMKPWMTIEGLYISAQSKNKEAAYDLIKYLTSDEAAKVMAVEGRQLPSNKSAFAIPEIANDPVMSGFRKQADTAVPMPNYAVMTLMWSPVTTAMNKIVKGTSAPQAAFDEAQKSLTTDIDALRKTR